MTTIRALVPMRPIRTREDEQRALDLFCLAMHDDPDAFGELVPDNATPKPVAIAEDGSAAEIELYSYDLASWTTAVSPLRRIVIR
jgi:hypothetical protein